MSKGCKTLEQDNGEFAVGLMLSPLYVKERLLVLYVRKTPNEAALFSHLQGQRFHIYLNIPWNRKYKTPFLEEITKNGGTYTICANSQEEYLYYQSKGEDVILVNQNAFLNWKLFSVKQSAKEYDFVVNAVLRDYKNHHFLKNCSQRYALITQPDLRDEEMPAFLTPCYRNSVFLSVAEVNRIYGQSRIGVIMSLCEGACHASTEYLLAGLPVVSVSSLGGRSEFYNEHNAIVTEASAEAVQAGIQQALSRKWEPEAIRQNCIAQMKSYRDVFIRHFASVVAEPESRAQEIFDLHFQNKCMRWTLGIEKAMERIERARHLQVHAGY